MGSNLSPAAAAAKRLEMQRQAGRTLNEGRSFEREGLAGMGKVYRKRAKKLVDQSMRY